MPRCVRHRKRRAKVVLTFYDKGEMVIYPLCRTCRNAASIAALVYENIISPDYEILAVEESPLRNDA